MERLRSGGAFFVPVLTCDLFSRQYSPKHKGRPTPERPFSRLELARPAILAHFIIAPIEL